MFSVLTLNKNRTNHLSALIKGLNRSTKFPKELIIVEMSDNPEEFYSPNFTIKTIFLKSDKLLLAKARNMAANAATTEKLLFLDVDCIPAHDFVASMSDALDKYDDLRTCDVYYLPKGCIKYNKPDLPPEAYLIKKGKSKYRFFEQDKIKPGPYKLFWSLAFGVNKRIFEKIGGFCEEFVGYGAEDTEFAYRAKQKNINHMMSGMTRVFHQYHPVHTHPYSHFQDIVRNAETYYKLCGYWTMDEWLSQFQKYGFIEWNETNIKILKYPKTKLIPGNNSFVHFLNKILFNISKVL